MEMEEKTASKRRKTLERELEWVRMAPKARQAKGKARLNSYDKLLNEDVKEKEEKLEIFIPNGPCAVSGTDIDEWGKKRLAYEIQKMKEGFYYFVHFESDSVCPNEVENHIRIMEPVIRYLCVRQDA